MTSVASIGVAAPGTFGRDGAMFEGLLDFVAQLSLVLWTVVVVTVMIRFVGIRIYRRRYRLAGAAPVDSVAAEPAASHPTAEIDAIRPTAGQQAQTAPVAHGPLTATTAAKDAALVPAEPVESGLVDVSSTGAFTDAVEVVLLPDSVPSRVTPSVQMPLHPPRSRHPEPRSPALATHSVEA
ncbi:hypothetical protein [Arthrobacter sp. SX1312]|uniref:hypothetical protein n=1 Tax=Arthrobacter sp. SX1312 TaxID=2058896 RepID=UPI0011B07034|nr:hypothetical protein [Arthrobacter sp. SX1312]